MDSDPVVAMLGEIRDLQRQLLDSHQQALRNQQEAIKAQQVAIARARKLQIALGAAILFVIIVVLILLRFVLKHYY